VLPDGSSRVVSKGGLSLPGGVAVVQNADNQDSVWISDHFTLYEFSGRTGRTLTMLPILIGTSALAASDCCKRWPKLAVYIVDHERGSSTGPDNSNGHPWLPKFEVPLNAVG
jgi:hypothetical protein